MDPAPVHTHVYTIAGARVFVDALADGLWRRAERDPIKLSRVTVLVPTRRSVIALREAFLRLGDGRPMLLPTIRPVGDPDEDQSDFVDPAFSAELDMADLPPAIPALQRQLTLTRLVRLFAERTAGGESGARHQLDQAVLLAGELARLLDQVQIEGLSFDGLAGLVPDDLAHHWRETLDFLKIVTEAWPNHLAEIGAMDPAARRALLAEARAESWRRAPPGDPVVIAGSTGSVPATAALMRVVCRLPEGAVVLPGFERAVDDSTWEAILAEESHPQHGMARLIEGLEVPRAAVRDWDGTAPEHASPDRHRLLIEAMRPAATTEAWRELQSRHGGLSAQAADGMARVDAPTARDEAAVIALLMRETLEQPGRTAALVTPDRALARRVKAELRRWDLEVDDSAGLPLAETETMSFWRLTAEMAASDLAPVPLLAALKHPMAAGGLTPGGFRRRVRLLERTVLRGPRPGPGLAGLSEALRASNGGGTEIDNLLDWLAGFETGISALGTALGEPEIALSELLEIHGQLAESLAETDQDSGASRLWGGEAGEDAANFLAELRAAADSLPPIEGRSYPALIDALLVGQVHRPRHGAHPRLAILGPLEARLRKSDLMILGGLNEGSWPPDPGADPWMSRPMRTAFGLPAPERRIGLSAHDFASACLAREVVLTRAERVDGSPTVPSRWLLRLETVLRAVGREDVLSAAGRPWLDWQRALDRPDEVRAIDSPAPRPPLASRPRKFSVTQIETWIRDPYAIYARRVLGLDALEPIDADPGAADRGRFIHAALDQFIQQFGANPPVDGLQRLLAFGRTAFGEALAHPTVWAFWWPRFERIADWFIEQARGEANLIRRVASERRGEITLVGPAGPVTLSAIADRIDQLTGDATAPSYRVVDYKTGQPPSKAEVALGVAPQLTLEALILGRGGFPDLPPGPVEALSYWRLTGGNPPAAISEINEDLADRIAEAEAGLTRLIATFDDPDTPYLSQPDPTLAPRWSDYDHLARVREWASGSG